MQTNANRQRGVVLIVSLIFLLLLTILAVTLSQTNILQLQMAGNDEAKTEALQRALAIVDAILDDTDNTPVTGDIGYRICADDLDANSPDCDEFEIDIPTELLLADAENDYFVDRVGPLETPIPYLDEEVVSSSTSFKVARQEITVTFDRSEQNLGVAQISQGYLRLITSPTSITTL